MVLTLTNKGLVLQIGSSGILKVLLLATEQVPRNHPAIMLRSGFRVRVQGSAGLRDQGSGLRAQGSGLGVYLPSCRIILLKSFFLCA